MKSLYKSFLVSFIVIIISVIIYILFSNSRPIANSKEDNIDYPIVETIKLISKKHVINITAYGEIISEKVVRIKYRDKGKIIRIGKNIHNGEYLKKGDLLFEVDSFNIKNDLKEQYSSKKNNLTKYKKNNFSNRNYAFETARINNSERYYKKAIK